MCVVRVSSLCIYQQISAPSSSEYRRPPLVYSGMRAPRRYRRRFCFGAWGLRRSAVIQRLGRPYDGHPRRRTIIVYQQWVHPRFRDRLLAQSPQQYRSKYSTRFKRVVRKTKKSFLSKIVPCVAIFDHGFRTDSRQHRSPSVELYTQFLLPLHMYSVVFRIRL